VAAQNSLIHRPFWVACAILLTTGGMTTSCNRPEAQLEEIRALQSSGDYQSSIELLRALLAQRPDDPEANYRQGLALVQTASPSEAIWPLRKVPLESEFGIEAGDLLAATLFQMGNLEEAVSAADRVLAVQPGEKTALAARARAYWGLRKTAEAMADLGKLLEAVPDDEDALSLRAAILLQGEEFDQARAALARLQEVADKSKSPMAPRACLAAAMLQRKEEVKEKMDGAKSVEEVRACFAKYEVGAAEWEQVKDLLDKAGHADDATALLRDQIQRQPSEMDLRESLARRLLAQEKRDEGLAALDDFATRAQTPEAWMSIGSLRAAAGQSTQALAAYRQALALNPRLDEARFAAAELLIGSGKLDEAEKGVGDFQEEVFGDIVRGRIALERGDAQRALQLMESALGQWPNNDAARLLAARAALQLGRPSDALRHLRESARLSQGAGDSSLYLARLYLARGQYVEAAGIAETYLSQRKHGKEQLIADGKKDEVDALESKPKEAESTRAAWIVIARSLAGQGKYDEANAALGQLGKEEGGGGLALAERARILRASKGAADAFSFLQQQKIDWADPANEPALRELGQLSDEAGEADWYRGLVSGLAKSHPSNIGLLALQAAVASNPSEREIAAAALDRVLVEKPDDAQALAARGNLARMSGDHERAISLIEHAVAQSPADLELNYQLSQALLAAGRTDEAEKKLRQIVLDHPDYAPAANDLAWILAEQGKELDLAADLAERAARGMAVAEVKDTFGFVQLQRGDVDAAIETLGAAVTLNPDYGSARYHLALALAKKGEVGRAREELRSALQGVPFPESEAAKLELARLEKEPSR